jgi:stage II sporulation protein D
MYKGYSGEYPSIIEAVDGTEGEMIRYDGEPGNAFYFKNSGGYTQNAEDVWANALPYRKSVKDEYCPSYPWSTSLSFDMIQEKLEAAGYRPGAIDSISITGRNGTGAVSELKIEGSGSTVYLRKENIRSVLGATIIRSNMFELKDSTADGLSGWKISNGSSVVVSGQDIYLINGNGTTKKLSGDNIYISNGTSTVKTGGSTAAETVTGGTANFSGCGYGHGVGMPQDSAVEMAKQGFTYKEILKYYYTDIDID